VPLTISGRVSCIVRRKSWLAAADSRNNCFLANCLSWTNLTVYTQGCGRLRGACGVYLSEIAPQIDADEGCSQHRWKEENEGFNTQKHGGFAQEHVYSQNEIAGKVFYFFLQIAHLLQQLMEHGSLLRQAFPNGVGSVKNIAYRLLEAWRNLELQGAELQSILHSRRQIRFDSS
jgi:hypothetical protein